jgi:hypothetical protein
MIQTALSGGRRLDTTRVHDRPKETVENVTASDALDMATMTIKERNRLKRAILRKHPTSPSS